MTEQQQSAHEPQPLTPNNPASPAAASQQSPLPLEQALSACQQGDLPSAERQLRALLAQQPCHAEALHLLGILLFQTGRLNEAASCLEQAAAQAPRKPAMHSNLGLVLHALGRFDEAATAYRHALALQPDFAQAHNNLGNTLQLQGRLDEAKACYQRAVALKQNYVEAWTNLGSLLNAQGKVPEALLQYNLALTFDPRYAPAHYNLGNALLALGREDEAWSHLQQALLLNPGHRGARINLGNLCHDRHLLPEALSWYDQVLALDPEEPAAHFHKGVVHLLAGDYALGWPHYEYRDRASSKPLGYAIAAPRWQGEPLGNKRILLHSEQGLGDTLHFLRYVPLVQAAGGQPILLVQPSLRTLATHSFRGVEVHHDDTRIPPADLHCPLPSLPLAFHTTLASLPAQVPYLAVPVPEGARADTLPWPASGLRVGLALIGNPTHTRNRYRSMPWETCAPILGVTGVHFFSLQPGTLPALLPRTGDLHLELDNVAATAARMLHLDLVITIDTMIAHLAGALGLPTWVMLDDAPDWRWMLHRQDSPWYPTARLFRQPTRGDWHSVAEQVARALRDASKDAPRSLSLQRPWRETNRL